MRKVLLYITVLLTGYSYAQKDIFRATFKSLQNGEPVLYAKVTTEGSEAKLTNVDGYIQIAHTPGAQIIISHLVYDTLVVNTASWSGRQDLEFYLQPRVYELREVTFSILGKRGLFDNKFVKNDLGKSDAEKVREKLQILGLRNELIVLDQAAQDGYVLGSPITYLYDRFSKAGKERRLYAKLVEQDRQKKVVRKQFDDLTVTTLTNYTDEELANFKKFCSFHPSFLEQVDALTLYYEIVRCRDEYVEKDLKLKQE